MKNKILVGVFLIIIYGVFFLNFIIKDVEVSKVERRGMTTARDLKEDFNKNLDSYLTDQFPFRNTLLNINSFVKRNVFKIEDNNDVYVKDDYVIEKMYPFDENSLNNFIKQLNYIKNKYLNNSNLYYGIIPDKSYYLDDKYLKIDYDYLYKRIKEIDMNYINLENSFTLDDYYKTDIHIKQPSYLKIINTLQNNLGLLGPNISYQENTYANFKGSSFYKYHFSKTEDLVYLTNDLLNNVTVKHLEYNNNYIYKTDALNSGDSYNVFLSGPSSLIEINNNSINNQKELIIFRDSFGSSLAPLLIPYYQKITLVDLRYINMRIVDSYLDFNNKDVLFLYSTLIVNNSFILKI